MSAAVRPPAGIAARPRAARRNGPAGTWVLLRGLARERRHWGAFPELLRREMPDAEVVALDLPGNGQLYRQASPTRIEAMAEWVRRELARRGLQPPYHVLALSLGAMVSVAWAHAHPEELRAAVLINTSLRRFSPFTRRLRPAAWRRLLSAALGRTAVARENAVLALTSNHPATATAVHADWVAWAHQNPVSTINALRQLIAAARYRAPAEAPRVPVLLLASRGDRLVDVECSRTLARHWECMLAEHPSAGHDLPLDDGAWVARQVRAWLATLDAPGIAAVRGA